jgi:hypothetical protein
MSSTSRKTRFLETDYMSFRVGDRIFRLSETEVQSEPESIFVEYFHQDTTLELNADENLFGLINAHLKGYEIFPLPSQGIPFGGGSVSVYGKSAGVLPHLSKEATLKNLLRDATDLGLKNLVTKIEQEMANQLESSRRVERQALDDDLEAMKGFVMLDSV